jgi:hypothetical protein
MKPPPKIMKPFAVVVADPAAIEKIIKPTKYNIIFLL